MSNPNDKNDEPDTEYFGHSITVCQDGLVDGALTIGGPEAWAQYDKAHPGKLYVFELPEPISVNGGDSISMGEWTVKPQ